MAENRLIGVEIREGKRQIGEREEGRKKKRRERGRGKGKGKGKGERKKRERKRKLFEFSGFQNPNIYLLQKFEFSTSFSRNLGRIFYF